ncbi:hypothetical protein [Yinghuangia sp. YIM S09857]|uniref:hypothetical protein n=1 Tax=Yinghuangia sp. YIM S09857 TaxID=3436929 RepID=UPI003F530C7C
MTVYGLFYWGGGMPQMMEEEDLEVWNTVDDARRSLMDRYGIGRDRVEYVCGEGSGTFDFPCVPADAHMLVWVRRGRHTANSEVPSAHDYPDEIWTLKISQGWGVYGVKRQRC